MASTTVSTQQSLLPQAPYLQDAWSQAQKLYGAGPLRQPFPRDPTMQAGMDMTRGAATAPGNTGMLQSLGGFTQDTLQGKYLNSNPYLDEMYNRATRPLVRQFQEATMPGIQSMYSAGGRFGSNAMANSANQAQDALGRSLGEAATDIYGQNYQQERGRQTQMAALAPQSYAAQLAPGQALQGVGMQNEAFNQMQENRPYDALNRYLQALQGGGGGTQTTTQPEYQNMLANLLGGGLGGAALGTMFGGKDGSTTYPIAGGLAGLILGGLL